MREAFRSKLAFSPWVALILGLPSALSLPLTEQAKNGIELLTHAVIGFVKYTHWPGFE